MALLQGRHPLIYQIELVADCNRSFSVLLQYKAENLQERKITIYDILRKHDTQS